MGIFTHWPVLLVLVIVLIILGPGKLPQIGGAIGGAIKEFRKSAADKREATAAAVPDANPPALAAATGEAAKGSPEAPKA